MWKAWSDAELALLVVHLPLRGMSHFSQIRGSLRCWLVLTYVRFSSRQMGGPISFVNNL